MSKIEKVSAAAVAAVLGFNGVSMAGVIYSDPTMANSYTNLDSPSDATFSAGKLTQGGDGSHASPDYSDFSNSGTAFTMVKGSAPGASNGQVYTISFTMDTSIAGSNPLDPYAGLNVIDSNNNITAGLFSQYGAGGLPALAVSNGSNGELIPGDPTPGDGSLTTYTLKLDPTNNTYFASYPGYTYTGTLWNGNTPDLSIANVALSGIDQGVDGTVSAQYSNFTITSSVPEPASLVMIGLGGMMLFVKRPKRSV